MIEFKIFNDGDEVPEWLLSIVPREPGAKSGTATFQCRCIVLIEPDRYFLIPDDVHTSPIRIDGAKNCTITAGGDQKLVIPIKFETYVRA